MYYPSQEEVGQLTALGQRVPIYREILADMETPVSAYRKVAQGEYSFLLESLAGGERLARYSFIGSEPYRVLTLKDGAVRIQSSEQDLVQPFTDPFHAVRWGLEEYPNASAPTLPRFHGGAVGYLGYDLARYFGQAIGNGRDVLDLPEAVLMLTDTLLVFDHLEHKIKVVSHVWPYGDIASSYAVAVAKIESLVERLTGSCLQEPYGGDRSAPEALFESNLTRAAFLEKARVAKQHIEDGDAIRVSIFQRYARPLDADPFNVYRALRTVSPSPYMYYLRLGDAHIAGASPQMLLRVEGGTLTTHLVSGRRPRGATASEDEAAAAELMRSDAERAKNVLLADLARNDVGKVCAPGALQVARLTELERLPHSMHLVSQVNGRLLAGATQYDALCSCFPAGSITGAPKGRAMELIAELEEERRGPFGGAIGYFDYSGNADMAVAVHTIVVKNGVAHAGIHTSVGADTEPEAEYARAQREAEELASAIELAETM